MTIDATAVASGVGITTRFRDLAGGATRFLPQRIALISPVQDGITATTLTKIPVSSSKEVGDVAGYNSPAYIAARILYPSNGDSVGTVPVDLILVPDGSGAAPAAGDLIASGGVTSASGNFAAVINGIRGQTFGLPSGFLLDVGNTSYVHELIRQSINNRLGMPAVASHTYGTVTGAPDSGNVGDVTFTAGAVTSGGAPKAGYWRAEVVAGGPSPVIDIYDSDGIYVATTTGLGAQSNVAGIDFTWTVGSTDLEAGDGFQIQVTSSQLDFTAGWNGSDTNLLTLTIDGPTNIGLSFTISNFAGGASLPDIDPALAVIGQSWTSLILYTGTPTDTDALDKLQTWGEGRWGTLTHKPAVAVWGAYDPSVGSASGFTTTRDNDRVNSVVDAPGSPSLPFMIAANAVKRIAVQANNNPPVDYNRLFLDSIEPGLDSQQWNYAQSDLALKNGLSTTELRGGQVAMGDTITPYSPIGEEPPAYRFVVDIMKIMNVIYNVALEFEGPNWAGRVLIPDGQATVNAEARTPGAAVGAMSAIIDGLAAVAIISDPTFAKANTFASISSTNPRRLNIETTVKISGNTGIKDVILNWGFFFGGQG